MENLIPTYVKTIENLVTLKLNENLSVNIKCYVPEAMRRRDGSISESGILYWTDRKTKNVSFYSQLSSSIFIKFKDSGESLMIVSRNKFQFIRFLQRMYKLCRSKRYYTFSRGNLTGLNMKTITEAQKEFVLSYKLGKIISSQPVVIKDESTTHLTNGIGLFFNKSESLLTVEELETLIDHLKSIDLVTFTQNAINSLQWKLSQFSKVHTQGIEDYKLKIKLLSAMDKIEMIGLARGMDLDVSDLESLKEGQVRQSLVSFFKSEIQRLTGEV